MAAHNNCSVLILDQNIGALLEATEYIKQFYDDVILTQHVISFMTKS